MIEKVKIQGFKSHKDSEIEFKNLTILCGTNGVGKSSLVHAMLLLREAFLKKQNLNIWIFYQIL